MGIYKVESNGKAPKGLQAGDEVVTAAGTYLIKQVDQNGAYQSVLKDRNITTSNFKGTYDSLADTYRTNSNANSPNSNDYVGNYGKSLTPGSLSNSGSLKDIYKSADEGPDVTTASHPGAGVLVYDPSNQRITRIMPSGARYYVDPGDAKYNSIKNEYENTYGKLPGQNSGSDWDLSSVLQNSNSVDIGTNHAYDSYIQDLQQKVAELAEGMAAQQYQPVDQQTYKEDILSFEEAYDLAKSIIEPQYANTYQQTAVTAAQNLDNAGLYDSLYGQQLAAAAQNQVNQDMNASIGALALNLQQMSKDDAMAWYNAAVNENQFGANHYLSSTSAAASTATSLINSMLTQAEITHDYNLQKAALDLQKQAQIIDAQLAAASISQAEAETAYLKLQSQAQILENMITTDAYVAQRNANGLTSDKNYLELIQALQNA